MTDLGILKKICAQIPFFKNKKEAIPLREVPLNKIWDKPQSYTIQNQTIVGLNLDKCELKTLPSEIVQLTNLTRLYLRSNQLSALPSEIGQLTNLTWLYLSSNQLSALPSEIGQLTNLTWLDLSSNQLSALPSEIGQLTNLTWLDLSSNQLSALPSEIVQLTNLTRLYLSSNQLTDLFPLKPLIEKDISIYFDENPLENPPQDIAEQGNQAILNYWKQLELQGTTKLYEAKIAIVGEGGAGKTSLQKKLIDNAYIIPNKEESTVGINVHEGWTFPYPKDKRVKFKTNLWDFGGQEVQYMTHQFFMTPRSLYILVADDRKQDTEFEYWCRIINLLGRENTEICSPILVVLNQKNHKGVTNFGIAKYRKLYPNLTIEYIEADLAKNEGHFNLVQNRIQHLVTNLPHIAQKLPALWSVIRKELIKKRATHNHISWTAFNKICQSKKLIATEDQKVFSQYLHSLGVIVHFFEDYDLRDFVILNPQWAVDAVYCVLEDKRVVHNAGKFTQTDLDDYWADYDFEERRKLLRLMLKDHFEVCYEIGETKTYIAPQLLTSDLPDYTWDSTQSLKFRFRYPFMPKGLISRLIVRLNEDIHCENEKSLVWKEGVVIAKKDCQAQVIQQHTVKEGLQVIDIEIIGDDTKMRKKVLENIRDEVKYIHKKSFEHIPHSEMIPCVCAECKDTEKPHYFDYKTLQRYEQKGVSEIRCSISIDMVSIRALLDGVFNLDFKDLKELFKENEIESIFEALLKRLKDKAQLNKVILLFNQWTSNENNNYEGVLDQRDYDLARDKIKRGLFRFLG